MTRNLFNTYKYKLLKKVVINLRQVGRAYDVQKDMTMTGNVTKGDIKGKISTQDTTLIASRDLAFYAEKGNRDTDPHSLDLKGQTRNFRGQRTTRNYSYSWYPACKETINRTYDELKAKPVLNTPFANDTTMGYGLYSTYGLQVLKAPSQLYTKQIEFAKTFVTKFEITVKTYWSMWTLLKKPVDVGVNFSNLSINDAEFYGPLGIMFPYPGIRDVEIKKIYIDSTDMLLKMKDVENTSYTIGELTINRK